MKAKVIVALIGGFAMVLAAVISAISTCGSKTIKLENNVIIKTIDTNNVYSNIKKPENVVKMPNTKNRGSKTIEPENNVIVKTIDTSNVYTNIKEPENVVNMSNTKNNGIININQNSK